MFRISATPSSSSAHWGPCLPPGHHTLIQNHTPDQPQPPSRPLEFKYHPTLMWLWERVLGRTPATATLPPLTAKHPWARVVLSPQGGGSRRRGTYRASFPLHLVEAFSPRAVWPSLMFHPLKHCKEWPVNDDSAPDPQEVEKVRRGACDLFVEPLGGWRGQMFLDMGMFDSWHKGLSSTLTFWWWRTLRKFWQPKGQPSFCFCGNFTPEKFIVV